MALDTAKGLVPQAPSLRIDEVRLLGIVPQIALHAVWGSRPATGRVRDTATFRRPPPLVTTSCWLFNVASCRLPFAITWPPPSATSPKMRTAWTSGSLDMASPIPLIS
jgi:hypothetical protein